MASKDAHDISSRSGYYLTAGGINKAVRALCHTEWIGVERMVTICCQKNGMKSDVLDGMFTKCLITIGIVLLLLQSSLAAHDKEQAGHAAPPQDLAVSSHLSLPSSGAVTGARAGPGQGAEAKLRSVEEGEALPSLPPALEAPRQPSAFSLVLTMAEREIQASGRSAGVLSKSTLTKASPSSSKASTSSAPPSKTTSSIYSSSNNDNKTAWPDGASLHPLTNSTYNFSSESELVSSLPAWDLPTVPESSLSTLGDNDVTLPANVTSPFSKHQWNTTSPARDVNYIPNINYSLTTPSPANTRVSTSPSTTTSAGNTFPAVLTTYKPSHPYTNQNTVTNASLQLTTITISTPLTMTVTSPQPILWAVSRGASTTPEDMGTINTATTTQLTSTAKHLIMATASTTNTEPVATTLTSSTMATSTTTITTTTQPHSTLPATPPSSTLTYTTAATTISTTVALTTSATTNINATTELPTITLAVPVKTTPIPTVTIAEPHPSSTAESEESPAPCNITKKNWIRTVLSIQLRRNRLDLVLKQNLLKGLNHALQRALNDSSATAQVEHDECSPHNVTLGYYVVTVKMVYMSSVVVKAVGLYGFEKLLADIRQHTALVKAILVPVANWLPSPSTHYQLKTVLRFVGPTDKVLSCSFVQMLEERLTNAFEEAQDKVLETYNKLRVEIQSVTQESGFPSVSVVYVVKNDNVFLNGTISSGLLNQLTAELVGYFLFYPPLVIAEPLEYHNLNTSAATKNYWVITVLQDVDSFSLEENYHSFASLMEQRLAELFVVAGRQGTTRVRRATTIEGYTVQMVSILRLSGPKNPAELTYYVQLKGTPIRGTVAAKTLSTLDSQTMALTLGHFVQLQAQPVVNTPSSRLWIIAVVTPMTLVMVVVIMLMFILCKKNRLLFKASSFKTFKTRSKTSYRRDGSYHHQPVQGFDYAKQHMGRAGEETVAVTKETLTLGLPVRDAPLSLDKKAPQDGTVNKRPPSADIHKGGRLPSEEGSVSSSGSGKLNTGKSSSARGTAAAKNGKDELHKRNDPYEDHTSSLRLISIKPMLAQQPTYSYPSSSSHSQDSVIVNGESVLGLKQKSDIEQYRNKLRQKARRKGYGEFSLSENGSHAYSQRDRKVWHNNIAKEPMTAEEKRASFAGCHKRYSQPREATYWSRQSLSSPSPVEAEMDLLVLRERSRRGIRNNGYDDEPEPFEETNLDRLMSSLGYSRGGTIGRGSVGIRGHRGSDSSTISSQPSTDEVQTQMHMLLGNAFAMGPPDHDPPSPPIHRKNYQNRNHHHHAHSVHNPSHTSPYSEGVTSAPGTMNHPRGGCQRSSGCGPDKNQCSLPKPGFRFTQLPDMGVGSPPPLIPSRPGPHSGTSLRRSTPDVTVKPRLSTEASEGQHNATPYLPLSRAPFPAVTVDQSMTTYSGNPMTAVYAISANRPGYSDYFVMSPPSSYRSPSWMSYPPEPEDIPQQWNDTPVLPGPEGPGSFSFPIYTKTV